MYGHTFAQALCKLKGDELRLVYVLCCDTAVQELLVSKIRDWIKRDPERFSRKLEEKTLAYREWDDNELRLGILLELAERAKLLGAPLTTPGELEQFAGTIVEQVELGASQDDGAYYAYREDRPESGELETLIDYQIAQLVLALGRLLDTAPQTEWDEYMQRIESLLPDTPELWETAPPVEERVQDVRVIERDFEDINSQVNEEIDFRGSQKEAGIPQPVDDERKGVRLDKTEPEDILSSPVIPGSMNGAYPRETNLDKSLEEAHILNNEEVPADAESVESPEPDAPPRPSGAKLLLAALEQQEGFAYYETVMTLLASAEGLLGFGRTTVLDGQRIDFLAVSASPVFLQMIPVGVKPAHLSLRGLNPQRRRLPLLMLQLFLPELVSGDEQAADYEPLLALWRSRAEAHAALKAEIEEEDSQIDYYKRESASCAEQLETARAEREGSEARIVQIRSSLVDKLRVSSMQLPYISDSFDRLLQEYADNRHRMTNAETTRQERSPGFSGLVKYTLNYAASSVTLLDLRRKQDRLLERMADEALRTDGEWGQGERYVVAAERERIGHLNTEISRLESLQTEYREQLRQSEQSRKALEQEMKNLEKRVYGLADL
ncbi:hypothetical protein [Saccharibacillus kuerlensis]|uniref:Uncharacterized protein n=1 Tax=Saccharibacillus kuerlensis TaxID=459527 RepID=A0ABQ2KWY5_9BACL|nr:hypothetical protein [Saccharibacillus kuerlensis]GGN95750.1 hypothetical protein GCM10010969_11930 [Saccharibacillus kuerlensis]